MAINTHVGKNIDGGWIIYRNSINAFRTVLAGLDTTSIVFSMEFYTPDGTTAKLTLTESGGAIINDDAGTIDYSLSVANLVTLPRDRYFFAIKYTTDGETYPLAQGYTQIVSETNPGTTLTSVTIPVSVSSTQINMTVTMAGGGGAWGDITGTLSDQTDLQSALDAKADQTYVDDGLDQSATYADNKVVQTITNGVTTTAPSEDAVFDALALKANIASPTLTGTPAAPTASVGTNTTQIATTAFGNANYWKIGAAGASTVLTGVTNIGGAQNLNFGVTTPLTGFFVSATSESKQTVTNGSFTGLIAVQDSNDRILLQTTTTETGTAFQTISDGSVGFNSSGASSTRGFTVSGFNNVKIDLGSDATGDILQRSSSGALSRLPSVATGNVLISGGVGAINSWGKVTSSHIDATVAPIASPTFTGTPTLPTGTIATTQSAGNSTTAIATTAFVTTADNLKANLASPTFTGTPTLPTGTIAVTQSAGNSTTAIATTAFATTADNLKVAKTTTIAGLDLSTNRTAAEINDALKTRRVFYVNNVSSSVTGTTSETILGSALVPAGTLQANDIVKFTATFSKSGTAGTLHARIRVNTANSLGGSPTQLARYNPSSTNIFVKMERDLVFKNSLSSQVIFNNTTSSESGLGAGTNAITTLTNNYANEQYFLVTVALSDGADTGTLESWYVEIIRGN